MDIYADEFNRITEVMRSEMLETEGAVIEEWVGTDIECDLSVYSGIRISGCFYDPLESALVFDSEGFSFFFNVEDVDEAIRVSSNVNSDVMNAGVSASGLIGGPVLTFGAVDGHKVTMVVESPEDQSEFEMVFLRVATFDR